MGGLFDFVGDVIGVGIVIDVSLCVENVKRTRIARPFDYTFDDVGVLIHFESFLKISHIF